MRGSWRPNKDCNILTPNSFGYHSLSFLFSWAAQPGDWGPSLCWDMVLIPASSLQLIWTSCHWGYIIIWCPPTSCEHHIHTQFNPSTVKVIPWYLRPDAPVIYTGAFLILTARPGSICNTIKLFLYMFNQCPYSSIDMTASWKKWFYFIR